MIMQEGLLVRWLADDGAAVAEGEPLFDMETSKVELKVEAEEAGVLKQLVPAGTTVEPGAIVGCLLTADESEVPSEILDALAAQPVLGAGDATPTAAEPAPAQADVAPVAVARAPGERIVATPIARRIAAEHDVDLAQITGSGSGGRITEADVRQHLDGGAAGEGPAQAPAGAAPYSGRRRTIGERMLESLQSMAQLTLSSEVRVDEAMQMLHGVNREWRSERVVATLTALVMKACALALREHPRLNVRLDADSIVSESEVNVGFAVDREEGLMVPVVRHADELSLQALARAVADLTERAGDDRLELDDVSGATFTVTSLEGLKVDVFTPVINPPQAAILGVGRVREVPVFEGTQVVRGQVTTLSLTFDHRVVDGAPAGRFLGRVDELLGRPYMLM